MSRPRSGHICGSRFYDNSLPDGVVWVDGRELTASEDTWLMLGNSGTLQQAVQYLRGLEDGQHQVLRRFIHPFEMPLGAETNPNARAAGRTSLNTVVCPTCGGGETRLRRWFMGSRTVWWCDECVQPVPTLRVVTAC